jgi:hypothetical protein
MHALSMVGRPLAGALLVALLAGGLGCDAAGARGAVSPERIRGDIVAIRQFYAIDPWIFDDEGRVTGLMARVYFVAPRAKDGEPKGFFVPGTIDVTMHVLNPRPDGTYERVSVYNWSFSPRQAEGFRITKASAMGDSYGLVLRWPPELNVMGREMQITFNYARDNGEVVTQRGRHFRVPLPVAMGLGTPGDLPAMTSRPSPPAATQPALHPAKSGGGG